jgi:hypothetical protein
LTGKYIAGLKKSGPETDPLLLDKRALQRGTVMHWSFVFFMSALVEESGTGSSNSTEEEYWG